MTDAIDNEIEAIKILLKVLDPLDEDARSSVLNYVLPRYGINKSSSSPSVPPPPQALPVQPMQEAHQAAQSHTASETPHLSQLREEKQPDNAIEMAVLVAYYLSHVVEAEQRKDAISTKDIETYFKIGGYRLPSKPTFTLPNSKKAGYFDSAGHGKYKLNPVGYNLAVHGLPRSSATPPARPKRRKKITVKKTTNKKSLRKK